MPKRILSGIVVSSNANKTITVDVSRRIKHKLYKKIIKQNKKYHVHDEKNEFNVGDTVSMQVKPWFSSCVNCGGRMGVWAVVIRPLATVKVLTSLVREGLGREPPELE